MTTINPNYGPFIQLPPSTPPPPPPPPPPTEPDGPDKEAEVIIVVAPKKDGDPYRSLLPYGGLSGAQESARRDMEFAMSGPEDRALMLGMNPNASIDVGRDGEQLTTLELPETFYDQDGWGFTLVGGSQGREVAGHIRFDGRGSELDQNARKAAGLPERTTWSPDLITPEYLMTLGVKPTGNQFNRREIGGDELDLFALARDILKAAGYGNSWSSNSKGWEHFKNGDVSVFTGSNGFKLKKRLNSGTSSTPAIDVTWNGVSIRLHSTENNQSFRGPK